MVYHRTSNIAPGAIQWDLLLSPPCMRPFPSAHLRFPVLLSPMALPLGSKSVLCVRASLSVCPSVRLFLFCPCVCFCLSVCVSLSVCPSAHLFLFCLRICSCSVSQRVCSCLSARLFLFCPSAHLFLSVLPCVSSCSVCTSVPVCPFARLFLFCLRICSCSVRPRL